VTIQVRCSCGKGLVAEDDHAGRQVRCPSCQGVVSVPDQPAKPAAYSVEKFRKCPGCKREWPDDTVVCVDCGYNFETGRKMKTKYKVLDRVLDVGIAALGTVTRYRVFRNVRGKPYLTITRKVLFIPLGSKTYDLSDYRAVLTDFAPGNDEAPDVFYLELESRRGRDVRIFRASDEEKMKELIDLVAQAGRLEIKRK
jgi:hypothetical protein